MDRFTQALIFAAEAHDGQKYGDDPYILHPVAVAQALLTAGADEDSVIAGLLHDIIEDTADSGTMVEHVFGERVHRMVMGLTHDEGESYNAYMANMPNESKPIKFFDSFCNLLALDSSGIKGERRVKLETRYTGNLIYLRPHLHGLDTSFVDIALLGVL